MGIITDFYLFQTVTTNSAILSFVNILLHLEILSFQNFILKKPINIFICLVCNIFSKLLNIFLVQIDASKFEHFLKSNSENKKKLKIKKKISKKKKKKKKKKK